MIFPERELDLDKSRQLIRSKVPIALLFFGQDGVRPLALTIKGEDTSNLRVETRHEQY
jgi:hypothetical protein